MPALFFVISFSTYFFFSMMIDNPVFASELLDCILKNSEEGTVFLRAIRDQNNRIADFEFVLANQASEKIIGKTEDELVGYRLKSLFPGSNLSGLFDAYVDVVEHGKKLVEEIFYDLDTHKLWFKINAYRFNDGIIINFSDISEIKNANVEITRSRSLYSNLVKHLPGVEVALVDKALKVVIQKGDPFKAITSGKKIDKDVVLDQVLSKDEAKALMPLIRSSIKNGKTQRKEFELGEELYRLGFVPLKEEDGSISHVLVISEDISIFRNSQNELRDKVYALESANESLEQFAYVASHDLQEPLRKIRAFGDRLSTKYADQLEGTGKDYIERMQNAAARMQVLIDDLLKFSRVGRVREPFQPVQLSDIVEDILSDIETYVSETNTKVTVNALPAVMGEPSQLRQLFQNLISNAIKFHQPDQSPEITITCEKISAAEVEDFDIAESASGYHKINIADNGIGFEEKYLDRIFNIFQRLHGRSEYKGTGIGLAICRKIVENHGGFISATSKPGHGSTFYVILPDNQTTVL